MEINADILQLNSDIIGRIEWAKSNRKEDKCKSAIIAIYFGVVSAVTTVCIGIVSYLPNQYSSIFGIISLVASASLTVISAWDGIFHHKKLWIHYTVILNELYELERDIRHTEANSGSVSQGQTNYFYQRFNKIMKHSNENWLRIRE